MDNQILASADTINACVDGSPDVFIFANDVGGVENVDYLYLLCDEQSNIMQAIPNGLFDFEGLSVGTYRVYGISFPSGMIPSLTPGVPVSTLDVLLNTDVSSNNIIVRVDDAVDPPLILTSDQVLCGLQDVDLLAQEPDNGAGEWFIQSGPVSASFDAPNSPDVTLQILEAGIYILGWKTGNEACGFTSDLISVTVQAEPVAIAGPDLQTCGSNTNLQAVDPSPDAGIWNLISGPNVPVFDPLDEQTPVTGLSAGIYTFEWIVSNAACSGNLADRDTMELTVLEAPQIGGNTNDVTVVGGSDGSADLCVIGGMPPFTFTINPMIGLVTPFSGGCDLNYTITDLPVGSYTFTVMDANGCASNSFPILIDDVDCSDFQFLGVGTDNESCPENNDGSIDINVTGGQAPYLYMIGNGIGNQLTNSPSLTFDNLESGTYTIQVQDARLCVVNLGMPLNITEPAPIQLQATPSPVSGIGNADGAIALCINGGSLPYSVSISPIIGSAQNEGPLTCDQNWSFTQLPAGNYSITVTDVMNCVQDILVNVPDVSCNFEITALVTADLTCATNSDGAIQIVVTGGQGPYLYTINDGTTPQSSGSVAASNFTFTNLPEGTYTVEVSNNQGCIAIQNDVLLDAPPGVTPNIQLLNPSTVNGLDGSICLSPSGGSGPYTLTATCGTVQSGSGPCGGNFFLDDLSAGSCTIEITDNNNCSETFVVELIDPDCSALAVTNFSTSNLSCFGINDGALSFELQGSAPFSYSIDGGSTIVNTNQPSIQINNLPEGSYNLVVEDALGCSLEFDQNPILLEAPEAIDLNISVNNEPCFGEDNGSLSATASGGSGDLNFLWNNGFSNPELGDLPEGEYTITVTDQNGCSQTAAIELNALPEVILDAGPDQVINFGTSIQLFATTNISTGFQVLWSPQEGLSDPSILNPMAAPATDTEYSITLSTDAGCLVQDSLLISVEDIESLIVVPSAFTPNGDSRNDRLIPFSVGGANVQNFLIFNRWGQLVYEGNAIEGWDGTTKGEEQPLGTYQYVVEYLTTEGRQVRTSGEVVLIR
ncbi:MAG: gliding motility-associated C-terminal domain-containing protein [Bacteroidota bacterium]